jgi:hypothetical protein
MITINLRDRRIEPADELAAFFFLTDPSSINPNGYDLWVVNSQNLPDQITNADITSINATMRARTPRNAWESFVNSPAPLNWLRALDPAWDLVDMNDDAWAEANCENHLELALQSIMGKYRRTAVVTKVLGLKRPRLIPICDRNVASVLGAHTDGPLVAVDLITRVRAVGRDNLESLHEIDARLRTIGIKRSLVRILDSLLWSAYTATGRDAEFAKWIIKYRSGHLFF